MAFLDSIIDYMETNGIGQVQQDIFAGEAPLDINNCISVVPSPSPEPNKSLTEYQQILDFHGRFLNSEDGYAKMQAIFDLFHVIPASQYYDIDGYKVYSSFAQGMINDNDRDSENRKLLMLSIIFRYRVNEV